MFKVNKHLDGLLVVIVTVFITGPGLSQQNVWTQKAELPKGKTCAIDDINDKIYIMGADSKYLFEYDPKTDSYVPKGKSKKSDKE